MISFIVRNQGTANNELLFKLYSMVIFMLAQVYVFFDLQNCMVNGLINECNKKTQANKSMNKILSMIQSGVIVLEKS